MRKKHAKSADQVAFERLVESNNFNMAQIIDTNGKSSFTAQMVKEATGAKKLATQDKRNQRGRDLNDLSSIFDILRSDDRHSSLVRFL